MDVPNDTNFILGDRFPKVFSRIHSQIFLAALKSSEETTESERFNSAICPATLVGEVF